MQLEIITGKGGVGKSALTAALGMHLAHLGAKVLTLATTDPRGLGAHLGRQTVSPEATEVRDGLFLCDIAPGPALQEYLRRNLKVPTPRMALAARAFNVLATTAPGIREIITIGKVVSEVDRGAWDAVIVDAPATGQIGAYLRAPRTVAGLVPSGRVREQADHMADRLADSARLTIVTLAEELPIAETREALEDLATTCRSMRVVANRVLPSLAASHASISALEPSPARDAAMLHHALYDDQSAWLEQLDVESTFPQLFGILTPHEVAAKLSEGM